jgi:sulfatase maturation enzyme AslB (radical SAM superfamily)
MEAVLASGRYQRLKRVTVDSNAQCRECSLRYLCGGFCRAWSKDGDPDAPPQDCSALQERARGLLRSALEALEVSEERWIEAGLPID